MAKRHDASADLFAAERRKIAESGVLDALIEYVEGKREMSSSQVSAGLGLLKKAIPDLSSLAPAMEGEGYEFESSETAGPAMIEIHVIDPPA